MDKPDVVFMSGEHIHCIFKSIIVYYFILFSLVFILEVYLIGPGVVVNGD